MQLPASRMKKPGPPPVRWFVYLLRCANGSLYTGITTDVPKRLAAHNAGKGSAYVRAHRPAKLLAFTLSKNRAAASVLEYRIKTLDRVQKLALARTWKLDMRKSRSGRVRPAAKV
jgi:putative endonuclease